MKKRTQGVRKGAPIRIACVLPVGISYARSATRGVICYARQFGWRVRNIPHWSHAERVLDQFDPQGVLGLFGTRDDEYKDLLERRGVPFVNISTAMPPDGRPLVTVDNRSVGEVAAEHFLAKRFRHVGFITSYDLHYAKERREGFEARMAREGIEVSVYRGNLGPDYWSDYIMSKEFSPKLLDWLNGLEKPVAVLCAEDNTARILAEAAQATGLRVPRDLAILGVDNDVLNCELSDPPLSSVVTPGEQVGYEAARALGRLRKGGRRPSFPVLIPASRVEMRRSTDVLGIEDEVVRDAMEYIRDHAGEPVKVSDVARHLGMNRRTMELRFRKSLHTSPRKEIEAVRIQKVKALLTDTDLSAQQIAEIAGFGSPVRLAVTFRRATGMTATDYRARSRGLAPEALKRKAD